MARRPGLGRATRAAPHVVRIATALVAAGVLVNAVIAGRARAGDWDIVVHGVIGNAVFAFAVVALVAARVARADRATTLAAAVLVALVFAQVGLGYSGRESVEATAWHIPNGVAIFGLATWAAARPGSGGGGTGVVGRPRA